MPVRSGDGRANLSGADLAAKFSEALGRRSDDEFQGSAAERGHEVDEEERAQA